MEKEPMSESRIIFQDENYLVDESYIELEAGFCDDYIKEHFKEEPEQETPPSEPLHDFKFSLSEYPYGYEEKPVEEFRLDTSFSDEVKWYMDWKKLSPADVYKKAMLDKSTFSKIMTCDSRSISKDTAISICFALKLDLNKAEDLLEKAGYKLSCSILRDVILRYCFKNDYDEIMVVNGLLDHYNQRPLGKEK